MRKPTLHVHLHINKARARDSLEAGGSKAVVSHNIKEMVASGHPQKQAVAAALHNADTTTDAFNEADHPRQDDGKFGSGGHGGLHVKSPKGGYTFTGDPTMTKPATRHMLGARAIKEMPDHVRDNTEPQNFPGGYQAYHIYAANKLQPKPSDKLKKVSEESSNYASSQLGQDYHYVANVDGHHFGVSKEEDPDADEDNEDDDGNMKQYIHNFVRLDHPDEKPVTVPSSDVGELFQAMRAYKAPDKTVVFPNQRI